MRGLNVAMWGVAFLLAVSVLTASGFYDDIGIGLSTDASSDLERVETEVGGTQNASNTGSGDNPFLGFQVGPINTLTVLWDIITNTSAFLETLGVPGSWADRAQTFARIAFGLALVQVIRGFVFE